MIEASTPRAVIDLYALLSDEDKSTFLRMLSKRITGEQALALLEQMSILEKGKVSRELDRRLVDGLFPLLLSAAVEAVTRLEPANKEELARAVIKSLAESNQAIWDLQEAELKKKRDPQPRNTERDAEIISLAKQEKTSGEIQLAIESRWKCTVGAVNQVIMRAKKNGQLLS